MEVVDQNGTDAVNDNNSVGAERGDILDQVFTVLPNGHVVAVSFVAVNGNVAFATSGIDKDDTGNVGLADEGLSFSPLVVAQNALITCAVFDSLILQSSIGGDKVREVGSTGAPNHGKSTVVTASVRAAIRTTRIRASIVTNDCNKLRLVEGQDTIVLEDNGTLCSRFADVVGMVVAHVNLKVDLLHVLLCRSLAIGKAVTAPREEIGLHLGLESVADIEPRSHDAHGHVINSVSGNSAVEDRNGEIAAPETTAGIELGITGHRHVQARNSSGGTSMLSLPVAHDETLEAVLILENAIEHLGVLTSV